MKIINVKLIIALFLLLPMVNLQAQSLDDLLGYEPPDVLRAVHAESRDFDTYTRELHYLRRSFDTPIPFYLAYPRDKTSFKGVVLMLHGITSSKDIWWQDSGPYHRVGEYRQKLLKAGYVLVLPDSRFHGQRVYEGNFESPKKVLERQEWHRLKAMIGGSVSDFRGLLDYVQLDDRFQDLPLGVLGMSLGAIQTLLISAVDERIDFLVPVFPPVQSVSPIIDPIAPLTVASKIASPCLLLISDQDVWYSLEDGKQLFETLSCKDKTLKVLSTPHELGYSEAELVVNWIKQNTPKP
tara:strand:+ start:2150 stop:3034 length:885 start_codon:yes stop_codon:yes gene_type:complete